MFTIDENRVSDGGAGEALLQVLVDAYADGCYRLTGEGTE